MEGNGYSVKLSNVSTVAKYRPEFRIMAVNCPSRMTGKFEAILKIAKKWHVKIKSGISFSVEL
jgi:hypothetical protein